MTFDFEYRLRLGKNGDPLAKSERFNFAAKHLIYPDLRPCWT
jgi:hypothetical protein